MPSSWARSSASGLLAGAGATFVGTYDPFEVGGYWWACFPLGAGLLGCGVMLADRFLPAWPRPRRWALGMGASGLAPLGTIAHAVWYRGPTWPGGPAYYGYSAAFEIATIAGGLAAFGLALGWATLEPRWRSARTCRCMSTPRRSTSSNPASTASTSPSDRPPKPPPDRRIHVELVLAIGSLVDLVRPNLRAH